jgi:hypothetical protein
MIADQQLTMTAKASQLQTMLLADTAGECAALL